MYLRNLMAMETEEMIRAQPDAVIVVGGCDKTLPAQIMAAASVDLPTVVIPVGPMVVGHHKGEVLGACTDCRRLRGMVKSPTKEIEVINGRLAPSGHLHGDGHSQHNGLPYRGPWPLTVDSATIPAPHAVRFRLVEASGKRAAEMAVSGGTRPFDLLTPSAFRNAAVVLQSIGGSTNGIIHLTAIANRTPAGFNLEVLDEIGREVPVLIDLKPSSSRAKA
jgi:dihydroxy-acid dehydratase